MFREDYAMMIFFDERHALYTENSKVKNRIATTKMITYKIFQER